MQSVAAISRSIQLWSGLKTASRVVCRGDAFARWYAKTPPPCDPSDPTPACRRAYADIPDKVDPNCPVPCERRKKKKPGILHRIKLRVIEGGTNFGTPFRRLECKKEKPKEEEEEPKEVEEPKALPEPKKVVVPTPTARPGVQVSVLGADTAVGQYVSLLLKQCPCIKKLRLYESRDNSACARNLNSIVHDLQHINTNCLVQAFSCACYELERCLQCTDIVLMLESGYVSVDMSLEQRFSCQAPIVKRYADAIANECPRAFVIVAASPIDCMVPLVAETLRETGWYDSRKLLGSLAVPEMRASTLAARALCLEPRYTRVPCIGGTEGRSLVPLFSKAVEYFDFNEKNANMLTNSVRMASQAVTRRDGACSKSADLSEAHALFHLVTKVAHAMLCHDVPRVTGFVETDACQIVSPAKFFANVVEIGGSGITKSLPVPRLNPIEIKYVDNALNELCYKFKMVETWCTKFYSLAGRPDACQMKFFSPRPDPRFDDCAYEFVYLAVNCLLNRKGICKRFDFPRHLSDLEMDLLETSLPQVSANVNMAHQWYCQNKIEECTRYQMGMKTNFHYPRHYHRLDSCAHNLT